ncbi:MAG: EF-hand domain-containing protein [Gammaproteobacteria bacterium]
MKSSAFRTLSAMLLVALPVQAAQSQQPPTFAALDKDKSGSITAEEAVRVPGLAARLIQLDVNADGKLSKEEYAALAPEQQSMPQ